MPTAYPTWATLQRRRAEARRSALTQAARKAVAALARRGVEARVIGSLARGTVRPHSDLDLLVTRLPAALRYRIETEVERAAAGLPFDVVYLDEIAPARVQAVLEEARDARELGADRLSSREVPRARSAGASSIAPPRSRGSCRAAPPPIRWRCGRP